MKVRAIAVASERTEKTGRAVGTVELECTPDGLSVVYSGVSSFSEGYVPGPMTNGAHVLVPWSQVLEARFEGERLYLNLDPTLTPHHRLLLSHFSSGTSVHHRELYRRRLLIRIAGTSAAAVAALLGFALVTRLAPERGLALSIVISTIAAAVVLAVAFFADRLLVYGGEASEHARLLLGGELASYLPRLPHVPEPPKPSRAPLTLAHFQGLLPRTTFAIVVTLAASGLGTVLMARYLIKNDPERQPVARSSNDGETRRGRPEPEPRESRAASAPAPRSTGPKKVAATAASLTSDAVSTSPTATLGEACRCGRPESSFWDEPLPRVSLLLLSHKVRQGRGEGESRRRKYTELDLAIVNNSKDSIREVSLVVLFYNREEGKPRELVSNRPLYYEGPLMPGQAIKWGVEAEGTEFEVQNPILGTLGDEGEDAAPADRVATLLQANHRPVRLHGALLLTYLGDARAKDALVRLREAMRDDEAPYLTRLIDATREVRVCRLRPESTGKVTGCLHNTSNEAKKDLGVKVRALAAPPDHERPTAEPPALLGETTLAIPGELAPQSGVVFQGRLAPSDGTPGAYEAVADRIDLLR
jgi:hypothetical protein